MKLFFNAHFCTDGDFSFDKSRLDNFFTTESSLYKGADIKYYYEHNGEDIFILLTAEGDADACRYAIRDLLRGLMCSIRTIKYWLVKDLYELLDYFHNGLFEDIPQEKSNSLSGNYDGTYLTLTMV